MVPRTDEEGTSSASSNQGLEGLKGKCSEGLEEKRVEERYRVTAEAKGGEEKKRGCDG